MTKNSPRASGKESGFKLERWECQSCQSHTFSERRPNVCTSCGGVLFARLRNRVRQSRWRA